MILASHYFLVFFLSSPLNTWFLSRFFATLFHTSLSETLSSPQTSLQDTLRVPTHVLHPSDLEQANPATQEEVDALKQEVETLRQELLNVSLNFLFLSFFS